MKKKTFIKKSCQFKLYYIGYNQLKVNFVTVISVQQSQKYFMCYEWSKSFCDVINDRPLLQSIRRVSEISHINELRREMSGMEHLASEYYEISR